MATNRTSQNTILMMNHAPAEMRIVTPATAAMTTSLHPA